MIISRIRPMALVAVLLMGALTGAQAELLDLGTATGGLMTYYNNLDVSSSTTGTPDGMISGYDENPGNTAYIQAQHDYGNTNGMAFQFSDTDLGGGASFNSIFSGQPVGSSQFGFDLFQLSATTYDPAGGVVPPLVSFFDNVDNTVAGATQTPAGPDPLAMAWAINDYKEPSGTAAGSPINSLFRGSAGMLMPTGFGYDGTTRTYTITVVGQLVTDGLAHWYNPAYPDPTLSSLGLSDTIWVTGTLSYTALYGNRPWGTPENTYDGMLENGSDQRDFYEGSFLFQVETLPVPEPATFTLLSIGLAGVVMRRRMRVH